MKVLTAAEWEATPADYKLEEPRRVLELDEKGATCLVPVTVLDDVDAEILERRRRELDKVAGPRCGDFVRFADGRLERVSHVWDWEPEGVQTSEGGSFYLGNGYVSFSGGLNPSIPLEELELTEESRPGSCWFFHHDYATAGGGVDVEAPFRVYAVNGCRQLVRSASPYMRPEWYSSYVPGAAVSPVIELGGGEVSS